MAINPFGAGSRPWRRITEAVRAASTTVLGMGELVVTDGGRLLVPDGTKALKELTPLATAAEVAATYPAMRTTAPSATDRAKGALAYIDVSVVPPVLKGWDGSTWIALGGTADVIPDGALITDLGDYLVTDAGAYLIAA